ncbi:MAG: hypothetical protein KKD38_06105 [Candidatus Delongbacteria bacterium]|nr:hypothetical protein [Candidatus Delongbacteria bacterium]MCG2759892.1 hypothetical protein [Candidatus Delongbacteria bacterium]
MYYDTLYLMDSLSGYASPKMKLTSLVKSGEYTRIRRGLYIKGDDYNLKTLANVIYGPSYISFEYALSYYGMIPERVETVTSAVYNKNKDKVFDTPAGRFTYRYINARLYFYGIDRQEENGEPYLIASKEKALCDVLYKIKNTGDKINIERLLFEDLRIDEGEFLRLCITDLKFIVPLYGRILHDKMLEYLKTRRK